MIRDKIIIVEDDPGISKYLQAALRSHEYDTLLAPDGKTALEMIASHCPDLLLLDLGLPDMDGSEIIRSVRAWSRMPIIIISARSAEIDKASALDMGADDYLTKPFFTEELLARVRALSRRQGDVVLNELSFGDLTLNLSAYTLQCGAKSVRLGRKEFEVIRLLLSNPKIILSKETLLLKIWGSESEAEDNNVEAYISFLRKKLAFLHSTVQIATARKLGYHLEENAHAE